MRFLILTATFLCSVARAEAQFPLPIPQRPAGFPLNTPSIERPVVAWGDGSFGQTNLPEGLSVAVQAAAGWRHGLALKKDGTIVGWGANSAGESSIPTALSNVVQTAAGFGFSVALRKNGSVAAWGNNWAGQTNLPAGLTDVVQIAAGYGHGMALRQNGTVVVWGGNWSGQRNVPAGLSNVVQIAAGDSHCVALKSDGTVAAWGANWSGQIDIPANLSNVVQVSPNIALKSDGTLVAWGSEISSQDLPTTAIDALFVASSGEHGGLIRSNRTIAMWGEDWAGQSAAPLSLANVVQLSAAPGYSLAMGTTASLSIGGTNMGAFATTAGTASVARTFTVSGTNLGAPVLVAAPAGFVLSISNAPGAVSTSSLSLIPQAGVLTNTSVHVRLAGSAVGSFSGPITIVTRGAIPSQFTVTGTVSSSGGGGGGGGGGGTTPTPTPTVTPSPSPSPTPTPTPTPSPSPSPTPTPTPTPSPSPSPTPTPTVTPSPSPSPTPTPTATPSPSPSPEPTPEAASLSGYFAGSYTSTDSSNPDNILLSNGQLALTLSAGKFTGNLVVGGKKTSIRGAFDATGRADVALAASGILIEMTLAGRAEFPVIEAELRSRGKVFAFVLLPSAAVVGDGNAFPFEGFVFNALLPASEGSFGHGFAAAKAGKDASFKVTGTLADGTKFTAAAKALTDDQEDGRWVLPLTVLLPSVRGLVNGTTYLTGGSEAGAEQWIGDMVWARPANEKAKIFPGGIAAQLALVGTAWQREKAANLLTGVVGEEAVFELSANEQVHSGTWPAANKPLFMSQDKNLKLAAKTAGSFSGSIPETANGRAVGLRFTGLLLGEPVSIVPGAPVLHGGGFLLQGGASLPVEVIAE